MFLGSEVARKTFRGRSPLGETVRLNGMAFVLLVALYALLTPGAPRSGLMLVLPLALGQVYILLRHYLKLVFYGSQQALFQSALAHADYTAAPPVLWPDSPAAERIGNLERMSDDPMSDNS